MSQLVIRVGYMGRTETELRKLITYGRKRRYLDGLFTSLGVTNFLANRSDMCPKIFGLREK